MSARQVNMVYEMLDSPNIDGQTFVDVFESIKAPDAEISKISVPYQQPEDTSKMCDFIKVVVRGSEGKLAGGNHPTFGIVGRLGAQQAQPKRTGLVSDADGSVVALAAAMQLLEMAEKGAVLKGDVIITTHIATHVSITTHDPVDFMGMPVDSNTMNQYEVDQDMDAIISIDTSKGNSIVKHRGMAISPTAKEGYVLRVAPDLVSLMELATGEPAKTFPITTQDITEYDNGVYHFNSIMQPNVATAAPVVGLAITAKSVVPGCETGASYENELVDATRYVTEIAKQFTGKKASFYDVDEYNMLVKRYGKLDFLQSTSP
tara:strand:- start:242 stop:1195 length:954 start_codon:yes stop_codon:yes gene_type:complete